MAEEPMDEVQQLVERGLRDVLPFQPGVGTMLQKQFMAETRRNPPRDQAEFIRQIRDADASWFSQNGEDGIILFLLSLMDGWSRRAVEIGAGDGIENNTTNLIVHHGFTALLVDPSWAIEHIGREFFRRVHTTREHPPTVYNGFLEVENVAGVVSAAGFDGDLDVLSIDVDGNDFWLARALVNLRPKILVLELNLQVGADACVSMRYEPGYVYWDGPQTGYLGASIRGYDALARERGLVFAGCDRTRTNGFWIERGSIPVVGDGLPLDFVWTQVRTPDAIAHQQQLLASWPWVEVTDEVVQSLEV